MDRLAAMQMFVRVVEAGSFTAVADQMNLARSAVTRQIAGLEGHLGVKLLARSTRRLSLTAAGTSYLEQCRDILDRVAEAESVVTADGGALRGVIRASVPMSLGVVHLMPLIAEFSEAHPEIGIDLDFSDRRVNLIEEAMDVAIRITGVLADTQVARRITTCRFAVVAAPSYLAHWGEPKHPQDLLAHRCLGYTLTARTGWNFTIDGAPRLFDVSGPIAANSGTALHEAALRGLGIAYQPTFIVAEAIKAGKLVPILRDYALPTVDMYAVFPGHRFVPSRVRAFVDFLAERIGPEPYWDRDLSL